MRITAAPVSAWRRARTERTCACTVTSSAVVGSSAMISRGLPAIAIAMTTRWRMPPENWCGNWIARAAGSGMSTSRSSSTARDMAASPAAMRPCATCPSMTWRPTCSTGFSVVVGSWKIMPTSLPRMRRSVSRSAVATSTPARRMEPETRAVAGSRPAMASEVTLLPEPDSPTMPSTSFGWTSKSMPRTAGTRRPEPVKATSRPRTERTGSAMARAWSRAAARRPADGTTGATEASGQRKPMVRQTRMLSMSSVTPPMFFAATIRPMS
jgi:hypothetical protein